MRIRTITRDEHEALLVSHGMDPGIAAEEAADATWYDFSAEVQRGVAMLDRHDPNWYHNVNIGWLTLSNAKSCVLGQLAMTSFRQMLGSGVLDRADYNDVARVLYAKGELSDKYGTREGFTLPEELVSNDDEDATRTAWEHLTYEWADAVEKLLANRPARV